MMDDEPVQSFANIWDALAETEMEAANLRLRSELTMAVSEIVREWNLTQAQAAKRLGITQPRLNDLLRGRVGRFSLDGLVELAERAGCSVRMEIERSVA